MGFLRLQATAHWGNELDFLVTGKGRQPWLAVAIQLIKVIGYLGIYNGSMPFKGPWMY